MALEIEIKLHVTDPSKMRSKIKEAKGMHTGTARQYDGIFDFPSGKLFKRGELFRLRVLEPVWPDGDKTAIITFKGKRKLKGAVKSREETEFETHDIPGALLTLKEMGLEKKMEYLKSTEFYKLGKLKITLDHFPHYKELGYFLELEGTRLDIAKGMKKLGLSEKDAEKLSYPEIMARLLKK
ncbi:MAG: class IV adenylate cyclase [Candidatus Micrarchaeota archaeon]